MAMELIDGISLAKIIKAEKALAADRAINITMQIARALREAHAHGVVHRDLKPWNVMVVENRDHNEQVKVLDFGLVKMIAGGDTPLTTTGSEGMELTQAGMLLGSPRYMAPEQVRSLDLGPGTDIYSLGIILYHMLAGDTPYEATTPVDNLYAHVHHKPRPIRSLNPDADGVEVLEPLILHCLEKDMAKRFQSAEELIEALKDAYAALTGVSLPSDTSSMLPAVSRSVSTSQPIPAALFAQHSGGASERTLTAQFSELSNVFPQSQSLSERSATRRKKTAAVLSGLAILLGAGAVAFMSGLLSLPGNGNQTAAVQREASRIASKQGSATPPAADQAVAAEPEIQFDVVRSNPAAEAEAPAAEPSPASAVKAPEPEAEVIELKERKPEPKSSVASSRRTNRSKSRDKEEVKEASAPAPQAAPAASEPAEPATSSGSNFSVEILD